MLECFRGSLHSVSVSTKALSSKDLLFSLLVSAPLEQLLLWPLYPNPHLPSISFPVAD